MLGRQRDVETLQATLIGWLGEKMAGARDLRLSVPVSPKVGFSNETFLVDATWRDGDAARAETFVVRLEPRDFLVFPEYDLGCQVRILRCLAETGVPVPRVRWFEEDVRVLGCPFYVMEKVEGEVPSEVPVYHTVGFCLEATPAERAALWWNGLAMLARIHALDWQRLGLAFLGVPADGTGPIDAQLAYYRRYLDWVRGGKSQPVLEAAYDWLVHHRYVPRRIALCWGDARLPNLMFRDGEVAAVLDWEMAFLGDPEADLGWWIFLDWAQSEGYGLPRLEGFPGKDDTIRRYEELSGRKVEHALYQEIFAAFRFGVIMARIAGRLKEIGASTPTEDFEADNVCTQHLAKVLGLPPPGRR